MPTVRAFIAIELSSDILAQVERLQGRVRQDLPPGLVRWVRPEGIHLTLKFLGDVDRAALPEIEQALRAACSPHPPFVLHIADLGCFPNPRRPRVIWIGIEDTSNTLAALQRDVEREIAPLGYPTDRRGFHPHLTLGRVKDARGGGRSHTRNQSELEALGAYVARAKVRVGHMPVDGVHLMRSELLPGGAVYSALAEIPLAARADH
jgi:2'-5' RNA ligase